jgi:hypothetical protein
MKAIRQRRIAAIRKTVLDVNKMEGRIARLEEFSTLTASESALVKTPVIDAETGLDRYKTGYLVEDMTNPFDGADVYRSEFKSMLSSDTGISPLKEVDSVSMYLSTGDNTQCKITGGLLTLPYEEKVFASVGTSTRVTNLNPFLSIAWNGVVYLNPPSDIWVESLDLPDIIKQIEVTRTVEVVVWVAPPVATPEPDVIILPMPDDSLPPRSGGVIGPSEFTPTWGVVPGPSGSQFDLMIASRDESGILRRATLSNIDGKQVVTSWGDEITWLDTSGL